MDATEFTRLLDRPDHQLPLEAIRVKAETIKRHIIAHLQTTSNQIEQDHKKYIDQFGTQDVEQLFEKSEDEIRKIKEAERTALVWNIQYAALQEAIQAVDAKDIKGIRDSVRIFRDPKLFYRGDSKREVLDFKSTLAATLCGIVIGTVINYLR